MNTLLCALLALALQQEGPRDLEIGHWVEVRGLVSESGSFDAQSLAVLPPQEYELLVGTVTSAPHAADGFLLLGQPVSVSDKTTWLKIAPGEVVGARVKVEGRWRGPRKFSARSVAARGSGRARLGGRIDAVEYTATGVRLRVMRFDVFVPDDVQFSAAEPLAEIQKAPERVRTPSGYAQDEDDLFGRGFLIAENLRLSGQLEAKVTRETDFDLDETAAEDRMDTEGIGRLRLEWTPRPDARAVVELRHRQLWRNDEDDGSASTPNTRFGETYVELDGLVAPGWGLRVGRQDFDDSREWIYDQNLDAARFAGTLAGLSAELSLATSLSDGPREDKDSLNAIAYLSNGNRDQHLAAWAVHRNLDRSVDDDRTHVGVRALGEWLEGHESWLDASLMRGKRGSQTLEGWGYDLGTTWSPDALEPFAFTFGYAFGSGGDPTSSTDDTFRQTGLQDNNAKFAGVTSFRYYGELLDPELANLGVLTAGVGARVARRTSVDLVFHSYRQDVILPTLVDTDLDSVPDGLHANLGWEVDVIFGSRRLKNWDFEVVGAWFEPSSAFPGEDSAQLFKFQIRRRF